MKIKWKHSTFLPPPPKLCLYMFVVKGNDGERWGGNVKGTVKDNKEDKGYTWNRVEKIKETA